jgi:hypothetical protein
MDTLDKRYRQKYLDLQKDFMEYQVQMNLELELKDRVNDQQLQLEQCKNARINDKINHYQN